MFGDIFDCLSTRHWTKQSGCAIHSNVSTGESRVRKRGRASTGAQAEHQAACRFTSDPVGNNHELSSLFNYKQKVTVDRCHV